MAEQPQNPFDLIQEYIKECVTLTAADLVESGNVVRVDDNSVDKPAISGADTPALLLRSYSLDIRPHSSSSGTEVERTFRIAIAAGWAIDSTLSAIEWKITCALVYLSKTLRQLKWEGKTFIYDVLLNTAFIDRAGSTDEIDFSNDVWVSSWPIKIRMRFETAVLEKEARVCHTAADLLT